ncbi:thioesterase [Porphyromonadaceae bacterium COT-184 OH4590]|nr:thioesterase [Porphyromonadaceae bacterium COT-184 OH4590]
MRYFEIEMKVRDYECDAQGIVNNANYLHYFEATRHELLESCGVHFSTLTDNKIYPVVRNISVAYKHSLRGSDRFLSRIRLGKDGLKYFFYQDIYRLPDMRLCVRGIVETVCIIDGKASPQTIFDEALKEYFE